MSNQVNPDAVNEKIFSGELGYSYHTAAFTADVNVYHTEWKDKTMAKMTEIPVDGNVERTWINMQGVNSIHEGVEVDMSYKPAKWFSLRGMLSVGNWRWTNNPVGYFYNSAGQPIDKFGHPLDQSQGPDHARMRFNQKDVKEGGSAQLTAGLGFNFKAAAKAVLPRAYAHTYGSQDGCYFFSPIPKFHRYPLLSSI